MSRPAPNEPTFPEGKSVVVGVDLGTSCSGISLMFRGNEEVVTASCPSCSTQAKEPTIMVREEGGRWLFGTAARESVKAARLNDLENDVDGDPDNSDLSKLRIYENFKLTLLKWNGIDDYRQFPVTAANVAAQGLLVEVYTECLKALKVYAIGKVREELGEEVEPSQIMWVLTVPAVMNDWAKVFMREVACLAGMTTEETKHDSKHIMLLHEPEAAAAAVSHVFNANRSFSDIGNVNHFAVGKRFLVLDCGGGTVDISTHVVKSVGPLKLGSLTAPSGGNFGSQYVNKNFEEFLRKLLRDAGIEFIVEQRSGHFISVLEDFETIKVSPDTIDVPDRISLRELLDSPKDRDSFFRAVERYNLHRDTRDKTAKFAKANGSFTMSGPLYRSFFEPMISEILRCTRETIAAARERKTPVKSIAIVGGFSISQFLRQRLDAAFGESAPKADRLPLLYSSYSLDPRAAVVSGAARHGVVVNRISGYTYGVFFEPDTFHVLVKRDENVEVNSPPKQITGYPMALKDKKVKWAVYRSEEKEPKGVRGATLVGFVTVDVPQHLATVREREMRVMFHFGSAEIRVKVSGRGTDGEFVQLGEKSLEFTRT